jgi:hypothetical protein
MYQLQTRKASCNQAVSNDERYAFYKIRVNSKFVSGFGRQLELKQPHSTFLNDPEGDAVGKHRRAPSCIVTHAIFNDTLRVMHRTIGRI